MTSTYPIGPNSNTGTFQPLTRSSASIHDGPDEDGAYVIAVTGEFDLALVDEAEAAVDRAFATKEPILFDLAGCSFIDSSAIRIFAMAARRAQSDGRSLLVVADDSQITRVFELTRLSEVVPLIANRESALRELGLIDA